MVYDEHVHGRLLTPERASERLRQDFSLERGTHRLASLRCEGGGPPYVRIGRSVRYPEQLLCGWARQQVSRPLLAATGQPVEEAA
jgi:hypothetical protein